MKDLSKILKNDNKLSLIIMFNTTTDRKWIGELMRSVPDGVLTEARAEGDSFEDVVDSLVCLYKFLQ